MPVDYSIWIEVDGCLVQNRISAIVSEIFQFYFGRSDIFVYTKYIFSRLAVPLEGLMSVDHPESSSAKPRKGKANKKDAQLLIRINGEERDEFIALCDQLDTSAAREIRRFIRTFVQEHKAD